MNVKETNNSKAHSYFKFQIQGFLKNQWKMGVGIAH